MSLLQKQREQHYDDKIKELHGDLEIAARELGKVNGELDLKRREYQVLLTDLEALKKDITIAEERKANANALAAKGEEDYKKTVEEQNGYVAVSQKRLAEVEQKIMQLKPELESLEKKKLELGQVEKDISSAKQYLETLKGLTEEEEKNLALVKEEKVKELAEIAAERKEVEDLIEKHGKILAGTEANLHVIAIYARRLQRYYNQAGIKINVLEKFNVKEDEESNS